MRRDSPAQAISCSTLRLSTTAVNILTSTPMSRLRANPLINPPPNRLPNQRRTPQVIRVETLPSRMAGQARLNPTSIEEARVRPTRISSFIRSKIRMLASTAKPMDRMKPPMWGRVSVTGIILNMASTTME